MESNNQVPDWHDEANQSWPISFMNSVNDILRPAKTSNEKNRVKKPYTTICVNDFIEEDIPPREYLLRPWLPKAGIAMIFAARGIGKTYIALEIAYTIASGGNFLSWGALKEAKVLYMDGEMSAVDLQGRVKIIQKSRRNLAPDMLTIMTPEKQTKGMPDLGDLRSLNALKPLLIDYDLIVIDNISTLCRSGNENEAEGWAITQDFALWCKASGKTVLFVHHAGKGGQQRGTSKREDVMDTVVALERPKDYKASEGVRIEWHFTKARGFSGPDAEPLEIKMEISDDGVNDWSYSTIEDVTDKRILELQDEGLTQTEIAEELGMNKSTVCRRSNALKNK